MTFLTTSCAGCSAPVVLDMSCLLVAVVKDDEVPGRLAYICPACRELRCEFVSMANVTALLAAGGTAMHVDFRLPELVHQTSGPPLTADDLIDFHAELTTADGPETLFGGDRGAQ